MAITPRALIEKLNTTCRRGLEGAIALCQSRTHFYVELEHWLLKLLDGTNTDLTFLLGLQRDRTDTAQRTLGYAQRRRPQTLASVPR